MRGKAGEMGIAKVLLDVFGFLMILGGALIVWFSANEAMDIVGGIVVTIGVALLSFSRLIK